MFFECASLKTISNIENVKRIGSGAFRRTDITEFDWPSRCEKVPRDCFNCSALETIYNVGAIKDVEMGAFEGCGIVQKVYDKKEEL